MAVATSRNTAWTRFQHLRWAQPHSLSGLLSIITGVVLVANTLQGNLDAFQNNNVWVTQTWYPNWVLLYCGATSVNAMFGYRLAPKAGWQHAAFMFRVTALLQVFLCYFTARFLPLQIWKNWMRRDKIYTLCLLSAIDVTAALALLWAIFSCFKATQDKVPSLNRGIRLAIFPLLLVATYPIQFAAGSMQMALTALQREIYINTTGDALDHTTDNYWSCILQRYPLQGVAMAAFIYVPTTVVFSLSIFGGTLYIRKIVTPLQFGAGILASAVLTLAVTVLKQELYLPHVSTQRIYLPCVEPDPGTWGATVVHALDFSLLARTVLSLLGHDIPLPCTD